jgi:hypothetical protein
VDIDPESIMREEKKYRDLPKYYDFGSKAEKEEILRINHYRINLDVAEIVTSFQ